MEVFCLTLRPSFLVVFVVATIELSYLFINEFALVQAEEDLEFVFSKALLRLLDTLKSEFLKAVDINEDSSQMQPAPFMVRHQRFGHAKLALSDSISVR